MWSIKANLASGENFRAMKWQSSVPEHSLENPVPDISSSSSCLNKFGFISR